jgi:predicted nucleic acid-binding Zn ribbon protein
MHAEATAHVVPVCTTCRRRSAEPHYAVGYYKQCERCRVQRARSRQRLKAKGELWWETCFVCGLMLRSSTTSFCSTRCSTGYKQELRRRYKAEVLKALGGACVCVGTGCWHRGLCSVSDSELLEVDHMHNNGAAIRRATRGGTWKPNSQKVNSWSRYRRALQLADHGMQLLCANCHRKVTCERQTVRGTV